MSYLGSWKIDDLLTFTIVTHNVATGVATDADSAPAYRVYEDETSTPILTGTMALLDSTNTAGFYSEQITLSAANGFEKGKSYNVYISATVNSVAGATVRNLQIEAEVDANTVSPTVNSNIIQIDGQTTDGNNATLNLKKLNIVNSAGNAVVMQSTGGDGSGLIATGNGDGYGISATGGSNGPGISAVGNGVASGIQAIAMGTGKSISATEDISVSDGNLTLASISAAVWANVTRTLTSISDSSGITTLLTRIPSTLNISGGKVESNVKQINDTTITGDGSGTPWGPA
jgi:hypothetical protein